MVKAKDITGERFGRLVALHPDNSTRPKSSTALFWKFQCDCGNTTIANGNEVRKGKIKSCGCFHNESVSKRFKKHGQSGSKLYDVWAAMKQRCYNPNNKDYKNYGNRGISMSTSWRNNFSEFEKWAHQNGYQERLSIDRINYNGNYEPNNCRWTNPTVQANNTRKNVVIEFRGKKHTVAEWAKILGITYSTLEGRLNNYGWSAERALTVKPIKGHNQYG